MRTTGFFGLRPGRYRHTDYLAGRDLANLTNTYKYAMPMSTSSNISLDENDSFFEFKYPQDSRFRLRSTHWKISDKDLTDAGPSNVNINLDEKFGNVKKCHNKIYEDKLVFQCEECNRNFKNEKGLKIHRTRIHGLMGQSFLCESFSSKIDKTRKNEKNPSNSTYFHGL
jgi:hypothetical protein